MSDWKPQVVRIEKVEKHPFADSLDIVTVLGDYPVVTKLGEYQVNDLTCYLPIDTIVPDTEFFYFLCPQKIEKYQENDEIKTRSLGPKHSVGSVPENHRIIKAKKLRGVYSQGLLIRVPNVNIDSNLVDLLSLKKYEEDEEENISPIKKLGSAIAEKAPQGWSMPYYDIDGLRKYVSCISPGEEIVLTEKLHGSSSSFCHDGNRLWVKSRNFYKKKDPEDLWWDIAIRYNLEEKLAKYPNLAFYGELYGLVKNFRYDCISQSGIVQSKIAFFDIWDVKNMRYLDYDDFLFIIKDLGLTPAPELYRGFWKDKQEIYSYAEGQTTLGGKNIREGFVVKTVKERFEPKINSRMQFKLVGEGYNLKK